MGQGGHGLHCCIMEYHAQYDLVMFRIFMSSSNGRCVRHGDSWQQLHALSPSSSFKGDWLVLPPPPSESHLRDAAVLEATGAAAAAAAEVAAAAAASPLSKKYPSRADSMRIVAKAFADVAKAYADAGTADDSADTADTNHTTNGANIRMLGTGPRLLYPDPQPPSLALPNEPPVPGL
ncbi:hypothetical protein VOLCADRAFT_92144 [Volvox carteri f. nagariensis]|uniref:Uncharacterized protein n=1 Tax=Volvox carteri f. nagariensis TaxID=3068 RepID=D8TYQ6_VOLCA|nr:uncharacterized protein VOLCADRAFT_92144 [Volvox carteri f. nagariensis]EFJ47354.1 hypothetical protein VOLCADRAFT_92144 [Volvox carteri f. nagariensis]|eukprot:XP_002951543.1 hypothetical protein VOLCADRAFT_92144 [Volvox carteri f. nagariensis]